MEEQQPQVFWFRIATAIGSLLTAAFLAWAGVVWAGWQDIADKIFTVSTHVAEMRIEVRHIGDALQRHQDRPWHDDAGEKIIELQQHQLNHRE